MSVFGGVGNNTLNIRDDGVFGGSAGTYEISAAELKIGSDVRLQYHDISDLTLTAQTKKRNEVEVVSTRAENTTINGGDLKDIIKVYGTAASTTTTINGASGEDEIRLAQVEPHRGELPDVAGDVFVNGQEGDDTIVIGNGNVSFISGTVVVNGNEQDAEGDELIVNDQDTRAIAREYTVDFAEMLVQPEDSPSIVLVYGGLESLQLNTGAFDPLLPGGIKGPLEGSTVTVAGRVSRSRPQDCRKRGRGRLSRESHKRVFPNDD